MINFPNHHRRTLRMLVFIFFLYPFMVLSQENMDSSIRKGRSNKNSTNNRKGKGGIGGKLSPVNLDPGNIVMGAPTDNAITANIILDKNCEFFLAYGIENGKYIFKTNLDTTLSDQPHEIIIKNLRKNTRYYYKLNYRHVGETKFKSLTESWFSTQRDVKSAFVFGVQGDSHPERAGKMFNADYYKSTINSVSSVKPDFYFLMGDDFSIDRLIQDHTVTQFNVEAIYKVQRFFLGNPGNNPPLFLVNGNHEQAAQYLIDGTKDNAAVQAGLARLKYFPLPAPNQFYSGDKDTVQHIGLLKDYYAFEWGAALFVVIDLYWHSKEPVDNQPGDRDIKRNKNPWSATLGDTQYKWLKHTLETSKARFKFVFAHHVNGTGRGGVERADLFEWGGHAQNGQWQFDRNRPAWQMPIHQLMVENKVTIFFQGHDHLFAKQEKDGVVYQTVPNPADDTHTAFNKEAYRSGIVLPNAGHLQVTVNASEVKVDYIRTYTSNAFNLTKDITEPYSYTIKKNNL